MEKPPLTGWRQQAFVIIFEADTPAGKMFDVALIWTILLSVLMIMLETVPAVEAQFSGVVLVVEWVLTGLFTAEYLLRLISVRHPKKYVFSFFGVVDLLAILPSYLGLVIGAGQSLLVIRVLRLLRIFRVLKLARYLSALNMLMGALKASWPKVIVFLTAVLSINLIMGTLMFLIEGPENGFTSIPKGVYWSIVTMTTVGYGDIAPHTVPGQILAAMLMTLGYVIIAVPTGILSVEIAAQRASLPPTSKACSSCAREGHDQDAGFCKHCGATLAEPAKVD